MNEENKFYNSNFVQNMSYEFYTIQYNGIDDRIETKKKNIEDTDNRDDHRCNKNSLFRIP